MSDIDKSSSATQAELDALDAAERSIDRAFSTGKADRSAITRRAQEDANKAVEMVGIAIESDEQASEAARLTVIASGMGNRAQANKARQNEREARAKAKADHRAATESAKQAYDAIRFSDPTKLGFLRVVEVYFIIHIALTLLGLILTSRDTIVYSSSTIADWIMVVLESVALYFIVNRFKVGIPFAVGMSVVGFVLNIIEAFATGETSLFSAIMRSSFYILPILYFSRSKRVRAVLVNDLSHDKGALDDDDFVIDRRGWPFYRNLIIYFFVFSVLGHWMEATFCQLIRLGLVEGDFDPSNTMLWRDWFYPFPMHGSAVVLIALILYPIFTWLKKKYSSKLAPYVISYLINTLTCTSIEFIGGLLFNADHQNWDYSNLPFNFMGQVCLQNALLFGVASSIIAWWVYPLLERMIARVRPSVMNIICIVVTIVGGLLFSLYIIAPPQGVDMGEASSAEYKREAEAERVTLVLDAGNVSDSIETLERVVKDSTHLPKEDRNEVLERIMEVKPVISSVKEQLEGAEYISEDTVKKIDEETYVSTEFKDRASEDEEESDS